MLDRIQLNIDPFVALGETPPQLFAGEKHPGFS